MDFPCEVNGYWCETMGDVLYASAEDDSKYWDPDHPEYVGDDLDANERECHVCGGLTDDLSFHCCVLPDDTIEDYYDE